MEPQVPTDAHLAAAAQLIALAERVAAEGPPVRTIARCRARRRARSAASPA